MCRCLRIQMYQSYVNLNYIEMLPVEQYKGFGPEPGLAVKLCTPTIATMLTRKTFYII